MGYRELVKSKRESEEQQSFIAGPLVDDPRIRRMQIQARAMMEKAASGELNTAANRQLLAAAGGAAASLLIPGGPALSLAAGLPRLAGGLAIRGGLGAAGGGLGGGVEAAIEGEDVGQGVRRGATLGAIVPPALIGAGKAGRAVVTSVKRTRRLRGATRDAASRDFDFVQNSVEAIRQARRTGSTLETPKIMQRDADQLFDQLQKSRILTEPEKAKAQLALLKFFDVNRRLGKRAVSSLGERANTARTLARVGSEPVPTLGKGSIVPGREEMELLGAEFGPEFSRALLSRRSVARKALDVSVNLANVPRTIMSSFDLSAPLRQGAFLIGRPKQFIPAFARMFKVLGSSKAFQELDDNIGTTIASLAKQLGMTSDELIKASGLSLTKGGPFLHRREEAFLGQWAEKLPIIGGGIRASQRAYTGFLNKLRADTFDDIIKNAQRSGVEVADPKFLRDLGGFINNATGRGKIPIDVLEKNAAELSLGLFSPRLIASRVNILKDLIFEAPGVRQGLQKAGYESMDPFVRKEFYKAAASSGGVALSVLGLAAAAGAQVEMDPRSSDFGKIRIGNTRLDVFAGFQQYVRFGAQLAMGKGISARTGEQFDLSDRGKQLIRFGRQKFSPAMSLFWDMMSGKDFLGRKVTPSRVVQERLMPLVAQDMIEAVEEWGLEKGLAISAPAVFGVGISTFPEDPISAEDAPPKRRKFRSRFAR